MVPISKAFQYKAPAKDIPAEEGRLGNLFLNQKTRNS
jgi:hypothetical protein